MRKLINISLWSLGALVILLLLIVVNKAQRERLCHQIVVHMDQHQASRFIDAKEVREVVTNLGYSENRVSIAGVNLAHIEGLLNNNPSIKSAEVYYQLDGTLEISVEEREPIVRIFNNNGTSYYLDNAGNLMPLSQKYTARVLVASGDIHIPYSSVYQLAELHKQKRIRKPFEKPSAIMNTSLAEELNLQDSLPGFTQLKDIYSLAEFITADAFWSAQINQLHVDSTGQYTLIPRVGNHEIYLGDAENIEEKFEKLMVFYRQGLQKTGWNEYETIDLRFKNQVVCKKK